MNQIEITVRKWLRENNYEDVADLIDEIMEEWNKSGKKQGGIGGKFLPVIKKEIQELFMAEQFLFLRLPNSDRAYLLQTTQSAVTLMNNLLVFEKLIDGLIESIETKLFKI